MQIDFDQEEKTVRMLETRLISLRDSVEKEERALEDIKASALHAQTAQDLLQRLAQAVQQQAHQRIAGVVSSCLKAVFDDPYELKISFERKRGRTEAQLKFVRRELELDPCSGSGGGTIDVAAFALRLACIMLHRPTLSRVIVMDEPFKFVSAQYRENVRAMLQELSKDMGVQIIFVTHIEELETGKVIQL